MKDQAAELARVYYKQGKSMAEAMEKAWKDIQQSGFEGARATKKSVADMSSSFSSLGSTVSRLGSMLTRVLGSISLIYLAKRCIELGSSVQEVQNVVDVAFRSMAYKMEAFSQSSIENFGMSELTAKKTGSTYMSMARSMGIASRQASDMAITLTGLTGDVASFFNISQDIASTRLKAVFTGETEAIKELGVVMTQANLQQYAFSKGINKSITAMTQAELVTLRYGFVVDRLNFVSGDFVRTQDSWANQTRVLTERIKTLGANIGKILTTVLLPAVKALNEVVSVLVKATSMISASISSLFGVKVSQNTQIADSASDAADAENDLAAGITNAANAAKKSLAGFDELNILQDNTGTGAGSGGGFNFSIDNETAYTPSLDADSSPLGVFADLIKKFDLEPLKKSFSTLKDAVSHFSDILKNVFSWAWDNILVPLSKWTIEEAAPASVDVLTGAFDGLAETVRVILGGLQECWDSLKPIFQWIGDTVLVVLDDLAEIGHRVAQKWKENEPKIKKTFQNIGIVLKQLWEVLGPILTWIRDSLSKIAVDTPINDLQYIFDLLYGITEILAGLLTFNFGKVFNGIGALFEAEWDRATNSMRTYAQALGIDTDALDKKIGDWAKGVGQKFSDAWDSVKEVWGNVSSWFDEKVIQPVKNAFKPIVEWFSDLWSGVEGTFSDTFYNVGEIAKGCWETIKLSFQEANRWFDEKVIQPVSEFFSGLWSGISSGASDAWETTKTNMQSFVNWIDEKIIKPISKFFSGLWGGTDRGASDAAKGIRSSFSGLKQFFKDILNGIISALNSGLSKIFGGINSLLTKLRNVSIAGKSPFSGVRSISIPQIPYLAQGAVLPPNKPFMAVVGDQKHGTNIEAPLATIQEAVAAVMGDQTGALVAGFEALLEENVRLRQTVEGISIGDDVIGQSAARYNRKMAVVRG